MANNLPGWCTDPLPTSVSSLLQSHRCSSRVDGDDGKRSDENTPDSGTTTRRVALVVVLVLVPVLVPTEEALAATSSVPLASLEYATVVEEEVEALHILEISDEGAWKGVDVVSSSSVSCSSCSPWSKSSLSVLSLSLSLFSFW